MQRAHRVRRQTSIILKTGALASAVSAAVALMPQQARGEASYTEPFTIKPIDWTAVNNTGQSGNFGFSNTNNTGQTPAGEAGGTFFRSNQRGYYADTKLYGTLNQDDYLHGEGEFSFGNGANANTDHAIGHENINTLGGNQNLLGIGVFEDGAAGFRFTYQMYDDAGSDIHGNRTSFPNGQYFYTYDWDPTADNLTVKLFTAANHVTPIFTESSQTFAPGSTTGKTFTVNAYGFITGLNSDVQPAASYDIFIDQEKYTTYMPKVNQQFTTNPSNWQQLGVGAYYGFSNTDHTGQESGPGEAGGTIHRDNLRTAYVDTKTRVITQVVPFGASGELFLGNANNPDSELFVAHQDASIVDGIKEGDNTAPGQGGHNMAGLYVKDLTPTSYRVLARIYTAGTDTTASTRVDGPELVVPEGQYKFDYAWDPSALTLTVRVLNPDGSVFGTSTTPALTSADELDLNSFGLTSGFTGSTVLNHTYDAFIDNVTYTVGQQWGADSNGNWSDNSKWDGPVPNGIDHVAYFGSTITAARTVTVDSAKTVGNMFFDSAQSYTIAGANNITIQVPAVVGSTGKVKVLQGNHTVSAPVVLMSDTGFDIAASSSLSVSNLQTSTVAVSKTGAGTLNVNGVRAASLAVNAGTVKMLAETSPNSNISKVGNLTVGASAKLDLNTSDLIVVGGNVGTASGGVYDGLSGKIQSGRNGGNWSGNGIITSASGGTLKSLGIATGSQVKGVAAGATAVWSGQTVTGTDALVMYTYGGDANLDGKINVDDYGRIDSSIPLGIAGWYNGDFNYDGKINVDDYGIIDSNIGIQGAPFPTGGGVSGLSAVPEPASMLGASLLLGTMAARRRRYRSA